MLVVVLLLLLVGVVGRLLGVGVVIKAVVVINMVHGRVCICGDSLGGWGDSGVVGDKHPPFLALQCSTGDLGEFSTGNELGDLCPGNLSSFLVREGDLLPQQNIFLSKPFTPTRQTGLLVLVPSHNISTSSYCYLLF